MATVNYTVFDGQIVEEDRGGTLRDYVPDPHGSTRALLDSSQAIMDTWTYWPYGSQMGHTGSSVTAFAFLGTFGYHRDGANESLYVRMRRYDAEAGQWQVLDSIWPHEQAYAYVDGSPVTFVDPSGLQLQTNPFGGLQGGSLSDIFRDPLADRLINTLGHRNKGEKIECGGGNVREVTVCVAKGVPHPLQDGPQPTCYPFLGFPGGAFPYWNCLMEGIEENCKGSPFDKRVLGSVLRCIAWAESSDGKDPGSSPPYGLFQIGNSSKEECKRYSGWQTDPCANAKCATYLMCDCMRRGGNWAIMGCGDRGKYFGGPQENYRKFQVIGMLNQSKYCQCLRGCGFPVGN